MPSMRERHPIAETAPVEAASTGIPAPVGRTGVLMLLNVPPHRPNLRNFLRNRIRGADRDSSWQINSQGQDRVRRASVTSWAVHSRALIDQPTTRYLFVQQEICDSIFGETPNSEVKSNANVGRRLQ